MPVQEKNRSINSIDRFLENFQSNSTKRTYGAILRRYFNTIQADPNTYFQTNRNYEEDLKTYSIEINGFPPKTQLTHLACIRSFLTEYDLELKSKFWKRINNRIKGRRPVTANVRLTSAQLKQLLFHADTKGKALFLLLASSGMRLDEALHLTLNEINLEERRITIPGSYTKNGETCTTFFTEEAKQALIEWLKERPTFLRHGLYKSKYVRKMFAKRGTIIKKQGSEWVITKQGKVITPEDLIKEEQRIFPFGKRLAETIWRDFLEKTGPPLNEKTNDSRLKYPRYQYHIHTLRKFFVTNMLNDGVPEHYVDKYVNHTERYSGAYTSVSIVELQEMYEAHKHCLSIFGEPDTAVKPHLKAQDDQMMKIIQDNRELNRDIDALLKFIYYSTGEPPVEAWEERLRKEFLESFRHRLPKGLYKD